MIWAMLWISIGGLLPFLMNFSQGITYGYQINGVEQFWLSQCIIIWIYVFLIFFWPLRVVAHLRVGR